MFTHARGVHVYLPVDDFVIYLDVVIVQSVLVAEGNVYLGSHGDIKFHGIWRRLLHVDNALKTDKRKSLLAPLVDLNGTVAAHTITTESSTEEKVLLACSRPKRHDHAELMCELYGRTSSAVHLAADAHDTHRICLHQYLRSARFALEEHQFGIRMQALHCAERTLVERSEEICGRSRLLRHRHLVELVAKLVEHGLRIEALYGLYLKLHINILLVGKEINQFLTECQRITLLGAYLAALLRSEVLALQVDAACAVK